MIGFTSCSDDDDEGDGGIVGTWQSVNVDTWEEIDGERSTYSGPYTQSTIVFTAEGKISVTEEEEEGEVETETATYKFKGDKLVIEADGETAEVKVLALSNDELILEYLESDEGYKYYTKVKFRRVK